MLSILLIFACQDAAPPSEVSDRRPSFVVIDIDSLRMDRMIAQGDAAPVSPQLNSMAREGIFLNSVYAPASWTYPSLTGLLTGQSPPISDYDGNTVAWIPESRRSLPEILSYYGYITEVFWGETLPAQQARFSQIFGKECTDCTDKGFQGPLQWLKTAPSDSPFFLFVHNIDLHHYTPSIPFDALHQNVEAVSGCRQSDIPNVSQSLESRLSPAEAKSHVIAHYDGMLQFYDSQLTKLFSAIKDRPDADDIVVIVLGNHGEALYESELLGHARIHHETVLRTGLIWHDASLSIRGQNHSPLSLTDVAPSILDRAGIPLDRQMTGRSFLPLLKGEAFESLPVFAITDLHAASIIEDQWKLSMQYLPCPDPSQKRVQPPMNHDTCTVLYDRLQDPNEGQDLSKSQTELKNRLESELIEWLKLQVARNQEVSTDEADKQLKEALKERGYWGDAQTVEAEQAQSESSQSSK